ncbi:MAG: hypothetical protein IJ069_09085 [Prevotella sp.]|nr:hypothetical protein [Prevotella sp.]
MEKYKTINEYLEANDLTRADLKDMVAYAAIHLATDCARNFGESPEITEKVADPIYFLNEILDSVE